MRAKIVDLKTYKLAAKHIKNIFNTPDFLELNRHKVQHIFYIIVYKEESPRFGAAFGIDEERSAYCPFSAPFGYIEPLKKNQSLKNFTEALAAIEYLLKAQGCHNISMTLPPDFYDKNVLNGWYNIMLAQGWNVEYADLSFGIHIPSTILEYENMLLYNAKKNLKIAQKASLNIHECVSDAEKAEAYGIIKENRKAKGYPLRMTEKQVMETLQTVPGKMFLVTFETISCAAALIYDVTDTIAQVIYWGDLPQYSDKKVINFLAHQLVDLYAKRGFTYLDIGPSSEEGILNLGLCDFKDSIGCERTAKFRWNKTL